MIDDLDMNAGYDDEEYVDLDDLQEELGSLGTFGDKGLMRAKVFDKYQNYDDDEDFVENFDDE